jgi:hypothetical protein
MTYTPKFTEDFVRTPVRHMMNRRKNQILTSVIISTVQKPGKVDSVSYAYDLEAFYMPEEMQKDCFVLTFDEDCNVIAGDWFKEGEIDKIPSASNNPADRFIFDKCLDMYDAFIEKLKNEDCLA